MEPILTCRDYQFNILKCDIYNSLLSSFCDTPTRAFILIWMFTYLYILDIEIMWEHA